TLKPHQNRWPPSATQREVASSQGSKQRFPITVFFTPTLEGEAVFSLKCDVKRKTQPLSLNIKATGYSVHTSVRCEDSDGCVTELSAQEINVIDFKEVQLNKNVQHLFSIHNNSKFSFTFSWELSGPAACKQVLTVTPQTVLQAKGKAETQLAFHPQRMCSLKDVELTLQVRHQGLIRDLHLLRSSLAAGAQS
ncbi:hydrocephalus-inducing protein-like, partial [Strix uralensis]|uniref:hydrocephalus-inducing protein-like n=1 Tax=Strix uralensis TaxID=36305 RepID=UPI003DA56CA4